MRRLIKTALTTAVVATMVATPALAEGITSGIGDKTIDVDAVYSDISTVPDVYSVDIEWGKMEFTYKRSGTTDWDADNFKYVDNTSYEWIPSGNDITVTNHSNKDVNVKLDYTNISTDTVTGSFDKTDIILEKGIENDKDNAKKETSLLTLSGQLSNNKTTLTKVGEITVTLSSVVNE